MIDEEEKIIQAEEETQESLKQKSVFHAELSDCQIGSKRLADVRNDLIHAVQEPQDHLSSLGEAEVERREQRQSTGEVLNEEVEEEREEQQQAAGLCGLENPTASVCYFNSGLQVRYLIDIADKSNYGYRQRNKVNGYHGAEDH